MTENDGQVPDTQNSAAEQVQEQSNTVSEQASNTEQSPKLYPEEEMKKVRNEAAANRVKAKEHETQAIELQKKLEELEAENNNLKSENSTLKTENSTFKMQKVEATTQAAVSKAASEAGAIYPDMILNIINKSSIQIDEEGNVEPESLKIAIDKLKSERSQLFKGVGKDVGAKISGEVPQGGLNSFLRTGKF